MTEYLDIVEERDGYRVRLEYDDSGEQPYDDGATPILTVERSRTWGSYNVAAFNSQGEEYVSAVSAILERHSIETVERYLRMFHGTVKVETFYSEGIQGWYLAFDTAHWREHVGAPVESLDGYSYLAEVRAWAEGDVYGYIVERNVAFTKTWESGDAEEGSEWLQVQDGSCWGFYGRDYAEEAAKQALTDCITLESKA
jgi:hypothetical protein